MSDVRVCPNCGAVVTGETTQCPRCEHPLDQAVIVAALPPDVVAPPPSLPESGPAAPDDTPAEAVAHAEAVAQPAEDAPGEGPEPEDRALLPTTEFNPVETGDIAGDNAPEDVAESPEDDDAAEAPQIVEWPAVQETMPDTPVRLFDDEPPVAGEGEDDLPPHPWLAEMAEAVETQPRLEDDLRTPGETIPRLTGDLIEPSDDMDRTNPRSLPGAPPAPAPEAESAPVHPAGMTQPRPAIPPAPYTPPPIPSMTPPPMMPVIAPPAPYAPPAYGYAYAPPAANYVQQRAQAYLQDGYQVLANGPHEAILARGKALGVTGWIVALASLVGFGWYFLILLVSGFQKDRVYITLEPDGRVYEDGSGAAHVRQQRSRGGRRWSTVGLVIFVLSFGLAVLLAAGAAFAVTQDRYQAALRQAYPESTFFEEQFAPGDADPDDVALMEDAVVAWTIAAGIAAVGLWGGLTLFVIGYIHAVAYYVTVPPLPGYG